MKKDHYAAFVSVPAALCAKRNLLVMIQQYQQEAKNPQLTPEDRFFADVEAVTLGEVVDAIDHMIERIPRRKLQTELENAA